MVLDSVRKRKPPIEVLISVAIKFTRNTIIYHLLQHLDCNRNQGIVNWSKLRLKQIEPEWVRAVASFVCSLDLSNNKLHKFQDLLLPLTELVNLDLSGNVLETVPMKLFQQANLRQLDLSRNVLRELPQTSSWSRSLEKLYLSNNKLRHLPDGMQNACLVSLKIDRNLFSEVPTCVPCILTLKELDLSYNTFLSSLPNTLGQLLDLETLNLAGVVVTNVPPKHSRSAQEVVRYLRCKLRSAKEEYRLKLVVLGYQSKVKQALVARLQGDGFSPIPVRKEKSSSPESINSEFGGSSGNGGNETSTHPQLVITDWEYKPKLWTKFKVDFSMWNFTGFEPYYSTYQCFLTKQCVCLLAFDALRGVDAVLELSPWLESIVKYVPDATVVVVGYYSGKQGKGTLEDRLVMQINNQWRKMTSEHPYSSFRCGGVVFVSDESDSKKGIRKLREALYSAAVSLFENDKKRMKHLVPYSYLQVAKKIATQRQHCTQKNKCPIMAKNDMLTLLHEIPGQDIDNPQEQKELVEYLMKAGVLMHFDISKVDINQLLFIDPSWLYELMTRVVYACPRSSAAISGLLRRDDLPILFPCHRFSAEYYDSFLRLLNRFSVAITIDSEVMLVPALLPTKQSSEFLNLGSTSLQLRRLYTFTHLATWFWNRLLARLILSLKEIAVAFGVDHQTLFQPVTAGFADQKAQIDSYSTSDSVEPGNGEDSIDSHLMLPATETDNPVESQMLMTGTEVEIEMKGKKAGLSKLNVDASMEKGSYNDISSNRSKQKPNELLFQKKTQETVSLSQTSVSPLEDDIDFVSLPRSRPQVGSICSDGSGRALHYWRYGMSCSVGDSFFCLKRRMDQTTGTDQELEVVTSANERGKKAMTLIVDILFALLIEWFPELLELPSSNCFVQQTATCCQCSRLGVKCANNFILETCVEACLRGTPVKCHQHIKEPPCLNELVPEMVFSDLPASLIISHNQLQIMDKIGGSGCTQVCKVNVDNQAAAFKAYTVLANTSASVQHVFYHMRAEMKHLQTVSHPNVVRLLGVCPRPLGLVLELAPHGSLDQHLSGARVRLERILLFHLASQIAAALAHLHSKHIVHRNLNPRAVLVFSLAIEELTNIKLCDFRAAGIEFPSGLKGNAGSGAYQAPEIVESKGMEEYDASVDIFSFAMVLYEMITYQKPFDGEAKADIVTLILQNLRPHLSDHAVPEGGLYCLAELVKQCWESKPSDRPKPLTIVTNLLVPQCQCLMGCQVLPHSDSVRLMCFVPQAEELWVFAEKEEQLLGFVLDVHNLCIRSSIPAAGEDLDISTYKALCAVAVGTDTVWVGVVEKVILIFNVKTRKLLETNETGQPVVSLVTCNNKVFAGLDHGQLSVYEESSLYTRGQLLCIGSEPIISIAAVENEVWCSCGDQLYAIDSDSLDTICTIPCEQAVTGLVVSPDGQSIWGMHRKLALLSCWDVTSHTLRDSFDCFHPDSVVNVTESQPTILPGLRRPRLHSATPFALAGDRIRSVLPVADTLWVGTETGFILIFQMPSRELLTQFRAHNGKVICLLTIDLPITEHGVVISGASGFHYDREAEILYKMDNSTEGTVLMWEAISGANAKLLEQRSQL